MGGEYFGFKEKQTSIKVEFIAGLTTFLTMAYIIFVNPDILSKTGMDKNALIAVTCIVTAIATIITGLFANAPIAMEESPCSLRKRHSCGVPRFFDFFRSCPVNSYSSVF